MDRPIFAPTSAVRIGLNRWRARRGAGGYGSRPTILLGAATQDLFGGAAQPALRRIAAYLRAWPMFGVTEFYDMTTPSRSAASWSRVRGRTRAPQRDRLLAGWANSSVALAATADSIDLEAVRCLGLCDRAPARWSTTCRRPPSTPSSTDRPPRSCASSCQVALTNVGVVDPTSLDARGAAWPPCTSPCAR